MRTTAIAATSGYSRNVVTKKPAPKRARATVAAAKKKTTKRKVTQPMSAKIDPEQDSDFESETETTGVSKGAVAKLTGTRSRSSRNRDKSINYVDLYESDDGDDSDDSF